MLLQVLLLPWRMKRFLVMQLAVVEPVVRVQGHAAVADALPLVPGKATGFFKVA